MKNCNIKPKAKWESVPIDGTLLSAKDFEGFSGIEELSGYSVLAPGESNVWESSMEKLSTYKKEKKKRSKKKKGKDVLTLSNEDAIPESCGRDDESQEVDEQDLDESVEKSRKSKKKRKRKDGLKDNPRKKVKPNQKDEDNPSVTPDHEESYDDSAWTSCFVPEPVQKALLELGFDSPTPIQALALPSAIRDKMDILGAAETGSGKTLAFGIPILHHILKDKDQESKEGTTSTGLRALVLTPTRELAIQIKKHICAASKYTDIKTITVVGGMATQKQRRLLKKKPDIIVATPGRLWELIQEEEEHLVNIDVVRYLVIDEADRMVERGHFEELTNILDLIKSHRSTEGKRKRQTFVFSATLTMVHEPPKRLIEKKKKVKLTKQQKLEAIMERLGIMEKPKVIDITRQIGTVETLTESRINCTMEEKDSYLYYFLTAFPGRTLVFCNSIDCVRRLKSVLTLLECDPLPLHASMHQRQRLKNLDKFQSNPKGLLLATDVAARGLDIPGVEHVIHFQVPRTAEVYIHRSGRTARAQREGLSLMLIEPKELQFYRRICYTLNRDEDLPPFLVDQDVFTVIKKRVNFAREVESTEHRFQRINYQSTWFERAAKEMDMEIEDDKHLKSDIKTSGEKKRLKLMRKQLHSLLQKPLIPPGFSGRYLTKMGHLTLPVLKHHVKATEHVKKQR